MPGWSAQTKRTFFRLGYGFTRSRNGAAQMHAALCIPAVTGAWQYEGGGAFFNNYALWQFDESDHRGPRRDRPYHARARPVADRAHPDRRCRRRLQWRRPVKAMLIQNTNPMTVAPEQALVRQGFAREDLFMVRA